jgi:hypothetical protein
MEIKEIEHGFTIGKNKYQFKELTLRSYYSLQKILNQVNDKEAEFKVVECLTGCPIPELKKLAYTNWLIIWEETQLIINSLVGNTEEIKPILEFKKAKYGFPTPESMTIGEFADLEILFAAEDFQSRLHEAAAILYRPVIKQSGEIITIEEYDVEKCRERAMLFLDLPLSAIRSANSFFLHYAQLSLNNIAESLSKMPETAKMNQKDLEQLQSILQQESGGISSIPFLEKTLSDFQKLRHLDYEVALTGYLGNQTKPKSKISKLKELIQDKAKEIKLKRKAKKAK